MGLTIHECLDWNVTANVVAQSANRALGLLIAKSKALDGKPCDVSVTKLFDSMVWSVIAYGASVWETRPFLYRDVVQNRAQRYVLGTAVAGDMGWMSTVVKQ